MRKVLLFLSAISLVAISSCSGDDSPSNPPDNTSDVLVKRMTLHQDDASGFNFTVDYTYDGNKLVQGVYNDGFMEKFYYTGDLITKVEYLFEGEVEDRELFTYDAQGRLIEYKELDLVNDAEITTTYTHNSNGTITVANGDSATITMQNGEISQIAYAGGTTYTVTYDNQNSPFKNVTGYAEIAYAYDGDYELHGRTRNILKIVDETHDQNYMVNTMQYNADGYPVLVTSQAVFDHTLPNTVEQLTTGYIYQ